MRIGILKAGAPSSDLERLVGSYPDMVRAALGPAYTFQEFDAMCGDLPSGDRSADAYVITGSASSVYDKDPWIASLREWLIAIDRSTPLVGICFGHQIMASAYGGVVERAEQGLAVGLHEYQITQRKPWMDEVKQVVLPVSHYDQVTRLPDTAQRVATSDFCPNAILAYTDRRAVSMQAHPEFSLELAAMAIDRWLARGALTADEAEEARATMRKPDDRVRVITWVRRFLEGAGQNMARARI